MLEKIKNVEKLANSSEAIRCLEKQFIEVACKKLNIDYDLIVLYPDLRRKLLNRIFKEAQKYDVDSEDLDMGQIYTKSAPRLKTSKWDEGEQYH